MTEIAAVVRSATPFGPGGEFDQEIVRAHLQRIVDSKLTVYLASSGSGEGGTLSMAELSRLYRAGVEVCKGKVQVGSNQPDQLTPSASLTHARLADECGVDVVQLYGPARWHSYVASDAEYVSYFDYILPELSRPIALSPNPNVGYSPDATVVAGLCNKYHQIVAVNLTGIANDAYLLKLRDAMSRDIEVNVDWVGSLNALAMGATGINATLGNFIPRTVRQYLDLCMSGASAELGKIYAHMRRVADFTAQWKSTSPRVHKMVMRVFGLPGGEGGVRPPWQMLSDTEVARFTQGVLALGVPEIDDMARSAGLKA